MAKNTKWSDVKNSLNEFSKEDLINMIKELYNKSSSNKMFITARFNKEDKAESFEEYLEKLIKAFNTDYSRPKLSDARKLIRDYKKATGDLMGTLKLMITYMDRAIYYSDMNGYYPDSLVNSVDSVMEELKEILQNKSEEYLETYRDELVRLHKNAEKAEYHKFEEVIGHRLEDLGVIQSVEY